MNEVFAHYRLWWLGQMVDPGDLGRVPGRVALMQTLPGWLERHAQRLVDVIAQEGLSPSA